jgi:hypothetical protein
MDWVNVITGIAGLIGAITGGIQVYLAIKATPKESNLPQLLDKGEWRDADKETTKIMLQMANREREGWLDLGAFHRIDCKRLIAIDRLWVKYSNGRFGFSVQKRIWEYVGGNPTANHPIRQRFADRVDWRINGEWIENTDLVKGKILIDTSRLTFALNAPEGHLPLGVSEGYRGQPYKHPGERQTIFQYLEICEQKISKDIRISDMVYLVTMALFYLSISIILAILIVRY